MKYPQLLTDCCVTANGRKTYDVSELYPGEVTPDDFIREGSIFNENKIPIIVIDEFIPGLSNQNPWAQSRRPTDMIFYG
jgi:hypothetical protein